MRAAPSAHQPSCLPQYPLLPKPAHLRAVPAVPELHRAVRVRANQRAVLQHCQPPHAHGAQRGHAGRDAQRLNACSRGGGWGCVSPVETHAGCRGVALGSHTFFTQQPEPCQSQCSAAGWPRSVPAQLLHPNTCLPSSLCRSFRSLPSTPRAAPNPKPHDILSAPHTCGGVQRVDAAVRATRHQRVAAGVPRHCQHAALQARQRAAIVRSRLARLHVEQAHAAVVAARSQRVGKTYGSSRRWRWRGAWLGLRRDHQACIPACGARMQSSSTYNCCMHASGRACTCAKQFAPWMGKPATRGPSMHALAPGCTALAGWAARDQMAPAPESVDATDRSDCFQDTSASEPSRPAQKVRQEPSRLSFAQESAVTSTPSPTRRCRLIKDNTVRKLRVFCDQEVKVVRLRPRTLARRRRPAGPSCSPVRKPCG